MMAVFATSSLNSIHHWRQISNHQTFLIVTATPAVEKKNDLDVTFDHRCVFMSQQLHHKLCLLTRAANLWNCTEAAAATQEATAFLPERSNSEVTQAFSIQTPLPLCHTHTLRGQWVYTVSLPTLSDYRLAVK